VKISIDKGDFMKTIIIKPILSFLFLVGLSTYQSVWASSLGLRGVLLDLPRLQAPLLRTSPRLLKTLTPNDPIRSGYYAQPTEDIAFKHLMHNDNVRNSFLSAVLGQTVEESELLDLSLNPIREYKALRDVINGEGIIDLMKEVAEGRTQFQVRNTKTKHNWSSLQKFLIEIATHYHQLIQALPSSERNTQLDLLCRTDDGLINVEIQVEPQDFWDIRILSHVCGLFQRQFPRSFQWTDLIDDEAIAGKVKRAIGVSIFEKAPDYKKTVHALPWYAPKPWGENEVRRFYRLTEENDPQAIRPGIEFYDFNLGSIYPGNKELSGQPVELQQWLEFLAKAQYKIPKDIEGVRDPALREAYHLAEMDSWDEKMKKAYEEQQARRRNISHYVEGKVIEGRKEGHAAGKQEGVKQGLLQAARGMKKRGMPPQEIAIDLGLTEEEVEEA
jgi:predicted transposase/invertase (TIGR01784 family)